MQHELMTGKGMQAMLWENIKQRMLKYPTQTIEDGRTVLSFPEATREAEKIAGDLKGFQKCGIFCRSELYSAIGILACISANITAVPLSIRYGEVHCRRILRITDVPCLIIDDILDISLLEGYTGAVYQIGWGFLRNIPPQPVDEDCAGCVLLMCTSGTTGMPKGVMITERNLWTNLQDIEAYFDIGEQDRILIIRPLYHCAVLTGEFLISLLKGCSIVFDNSPFNPIHILNLIHQYSITVLCGTPTLFYHLSGIAARQQKALPIRTIAVSGECMTPMVAGQMRAVFHNTRIYNVYGLTEASPRVSYLPPEEFDVCPLSVGYPLKSVTAKIADESGKILPPGEVGELLLRGPSIMKGYYRNPADTQKTLDSGWLHTGDLAFLDQKGRLTIKSRKDNLIIRAGMNIYPQEIENALKEDPRISEAVAYGIKNDDVGQCIGLKVTAEKLNRSQLFELCRQKLAPYQLPDQLEIVDSIPKNASGKIIRTVYKAVNY